MGSICKQQQRETLSAEQKIEFRQSKDLENKEHGKKNTETSNGTL